MTSTKAREKPHRLKDLTVTAIALVDSGACCTERDDDGKCVEGSNVVFWKRDADGNAVSVERNGKRMTKPEIFALVEVYASQKYPELTRASAIAKVALEPEVVEAYRVAKYAPIAKSEAAPVPSREEAMLASPIAREFIAKVRRIQKQGGKSLAQLATDKLLEMAADRRRQNPKLSDETALVAILAEGLTRSDMTAPDPVRFLVEIVGDEKSALRNAEDALQLDSLRAQFAEHGISL